MGEKSFWRVGEDQKQSKKQSTVNVGLHIPQVDGNQAQIDDNVAVC